MQYSIRHITKFAYDLPITESVMETRMQPRTDARQRCVHFGLTTTPASRVLMYQDHDGNIVHHFGIPGRHARLTVTAQAIVECEAGPDLPRSLGPESWRDLGEAARSGEFWEALNPSPFAQPTALLCALADDVGVGRTDDPLTTMRRLAEEVYKRFEYRPQSTRVDSPIDEALGARQGVCQDFAHILIALGRRVGVPCRYVSGYLFHSHSDDRSADGATHAWVEAWLPRLGWIGFDPTNNLIVGERHIRVAVGRDYADVPPTRGVFKGVSAVRSELTVAVRVGPARAALSGENPPFTPWMSREVSAGTTLDTSDGHQQQQQQQQQ
jgi:transglutaminase-like putative cysteine protease